MKSIAELRASRSKRKAAASRKAGLTTSGFRRRADADDMLLPQGTFRRLLEREQTLVDRHGHRFALAILEIGQGSRRKHSESQIGRLLGQRLRTADAAGWLDEERIGVILPYTEADGARIFAEDARRTLKSFIHELKYELYSFPGDDYADALIGMDAIEEQENDDSDDTPASGMPDDQRNNPDSTSGENRNNGTHGSHGSNGSGQSKYYTGLASTPSLPPWKRGLDVMLTCLTFIMLSPVFLITAIWIKIVSPGPVFFRQQRVGFRGRPFVCLKFRTMHLDADVQPHKTYFQELIVTDAPMVKLDSKQDVRLIPLGHLLRAAAIDELPQLLNVLRGEMSLVGPRPCIPYEYVKYARWHKRRLESVPGLTGLWQVNGKNRMTFTEMIRWDIRYSRCQSLWTDVRTLVMTIPAIIQQIVESNLKRDPVSG